MCLKTLWLECVLEGGNMGVLFLSVATEGSTQVYACVYMGKSVSY